MTRSNSVETVEEFWKAVWINRDPHKVDDFMVEDFVITNAGEDIEGRENFKAWIAAFLDKIDDLTFETVESFQNDDGTRVASRFRVHGRNRGILETEPHGKPVTFTGTAVFSVRRDGK